MRSVAHVTWALEAVYTFRRAKSEVLGVGTMTCFFPSAAGVCRPSHKNAYYEGCGKVTRLGYQICPMSQKSGLLIPLRIARKDLAKRYRSYFEIASRTLVGEDTICSTVYVGARGGVYLQTGQVRSTGGWYNDFFLPFTSQCLSTLTRKYPRRRSWKSHSAGSTKITPRARTLASLS